MSLWPPNAKAFIRSGWGFHDITNGMQLFRRAVEDMPCTIEQEHKGDVYCRLADGRRICADKRAVQLT